MEIGNLSFEPSIPEGNLCVVLRGRCDHQKQDSDASSHSQKFCLCQLFSPTPAQTHRLETSGCSHCQGYDDADTEYCTKGHLWTHWLKTVRDYCNEPCSAQSRESFLHATMIVHGQGANCHIVSRQPVGMVGLSQLRQRNRFLTPVVHSHVVQAFEPRAKHLHSKPYAHDDRHQMRRRPSSDHEFSICESASTCSCIHQAAATQWGANASQAQNPVHVGAQAPEIFCKQRNESCRGIATEAVPQKMNRMCSIPTFQ
mmetsp:Transcript_25091/g.54610  ORF Transcript_25091/g.54610 Transcript_25091/m.54610 type:complete len:256 (+) Transcript_25091:719-1486(+)